MLTILAKLKTELFYILLRQAVCSSQGKHWVIYIIGLNINDKQYNAWT